MRKAGTDVKEKVKQKMGKKLLNNLALKLISAVLAVIIWFLVVMINNPKDSTSFSNIQVNLVHTELLEEGNKVYEILDETDRIRVTVEAPRDVINQLRASDVIAEADVSRLTEVNTVPITCRVMNENVEIISITSNIEAVRLHVEDKARKWVNVSCNEVGTVAEGYIVAGSTPEQTRIEVSGPSSVIDKISYAGLEMDVTGATENVSGNVELRFYDAEDNIVEDSSIVKNANLMHVEVRVLATKEVPVELNVGGTPAEGYLLTGEKICDPPTVVIAGTASVLADISRISIPEKELDITDADSDVEKDINIRKYLDNNVVLADSSFNGRVSVTVGIGPRVTRTLTIPAGNIMVENLPEGFTQSFSEERESYRLRISGLEEDLAALDQSMIEGMVDIRAWMDENHISELVAGTYDIPVRFELPRKITAENAVTVKLQIGRLED